MPAGPVISKDDPWKGTKAVIPYWVCRVRPWRWCPPGHYARWRGFENKMDWLDGHDLPAWYPSLVVDVDRVGRGSGGAVIALVTICTIKVGPVEINRHPFWWATPTLRSHGQTP